MPRTWGTRETFFHILRYPSRKHPLVERGSTQEITYPYRRAASVVLRAPFTRTALVCGRWGEPVDEEHALSDAIGYEERGSGVPSTEEA